MPHCVFPGSPRQGGRNTNNGLALIERVMDAPKDTLRGDLPINAFGINGFVEDATIRFEYDNREFGDGFAVIGFNGAFGNELPDTTTTEFMGGLRDAVCVAVCFIVVFSDGLNHALAVSHSGLNFLLTVSHSGLTAGPARPLREDSQVIGALRRPAAGACVHPGGRS